MKNVRRLLCLVLALVLAVSLCACSAGSNSESTPANSASTGETENTSDSKFGGTLTVGLNSAPVSLNIWVQNDLNAATIMGLVCPHLVEMGEDGVKYNYLVESAEPNEDSTEWTVVLKDGLCWNDGTPVTAEDLAFSATYGVEHQIGFSDSYYGLVEQAEVVDDKTVVYHLSSADVNFWNGAGYWMPIMRKSEFEGVSDPLNYTYSGAGYGPYYVSEYVDGEYVVLSRNEYFTQANDGQGAYLDQIVFRVYTDENAMVLALQNGEVDVCANFISSSSKTQLSGKDNYLLTDVGSLGYAFMSFSQSNELLTDVNVRKAISMCANRDSLVNVAFSGGATPMYTAVSPIYSDFVASDIRQPAFDTAAAASLLEENGYKDTDGDGVRESADGKKLSFNISYKSTLSNVDAVMEILRSDMATAGIELVLQPVDAATFSANVTNGHTYDISYSSWGTIDDVDTTLYTCFGIGQTLNFMEYNNEEMDNLLLQMKGTVDYAERVKLLDQWQTLFCENMPTCHLLVPNNTYVCSTDKFEGWKVLPGNSGYLACTSLCEVYAK